MQLQKRTDPSDIEEVQSFLGFLISIGVSFKDTEELGEKYLIYPDKNNLNENLNNWQPSQLQRNHCHQHQL